jgi:hypothetical protein
MSQKSYATQAYLVAFELPNGIWLERGVQLPKQSNDVIGSYSNEAMVM